MSYSLSPAEHWIDPCGMCSMEWVHRTDRNMVVRFLLVLAAFGVLYGCGRASSPPERQEKQGGVEEVAPEEAAENEQAQGASGFRSGRCWDRTSDLCRVKADWRTPLHVAE
jgi:hypothetical protein